MSKTKHFFDQIGLPRLIIGLFFIFLIIISVPLGLPMNAVFSDILRRWLMYSVLVLAMVPGIQCGISLNFGVSLGIVCGLLGATTAVELSSQNESVGPWAALGIALAIGVVLAAFLGVLYGLLLNRVKGSEMTVSTYVGFSVIALSNIIWLTLPFKSGELIWPLKGIGLRNVINLEGSFGGLLSDPAVTSTQPFPLNYLAFDIGGLTIPLGLILVFALCSFFVWIFFQSKAGLAMSAAGENELFTKSTGISVDRMRILGTAISTILGAVGIIIYAQTFGFLQLYNAPLMMSFQAVASILIGGASTMRAKISHVAIGALLFQGIMSTALPVVNKLMPNSMLPEVVRIIISNGIILYALSKTRGGHQHEK